MIVYHSTSKKKYRNILVNGFNPVKYAYQHSNPKIKRLYWTWFRPYPQFDYGDTCIAVDVSNLNYIDNGETIICKELYIPPERIVGVSYKNKYQKKG